MMPVTFVIMLQGNCVKSTAGNDKNKQDTQFLPLPFIFAYLPHEIRKHMALKV